MTGPDDTNSTRPISVAELLARNGNIGSPPVTGRRRRHRGNADAVTVAELTGEIPIIADTAPDTTHHEPEPEQVDEPVAAEVPDTPTAAVTDDYRSHYPPAPSNHAGATVVAAEEMSPDFVIDEDAAPVDADPADTPEAEPLEEIDEPDDAPSYLRSTAGPLFGGQTVADDLARRGGQSERAPLAADPDPAADVDEAVPVTHKPRRRMAAFVRGIWIVAQSILAVAFGAGLFIAFDQLWKWNNIVALVLSVLVILGLVVGVRVLRKTEDIASTLIAVAVGALVTLGPLALLQSN